MPACAFPNYSAMLQSILFTNVYTALTFTMNVQTLFRVQQLQLVGSGVSQERFDKLWSE